MKKDKGFWGELADIFIFQPNRSGMRPIWKDIYRLDRELKEMERSARSPSKQSPCGWCQIMLHWFWEKLRMAWFEIYDEIRVLLTELYIFLVGLIVTIVGYVVLSCILFWMIRAMLEN